ncbi:MAG: PEP-CTERM sorting domain-containing protein [Fimbriiglobus sp.]
MGPTKHWVKVLPVSVGVVLAGAGLNPAQAIFPWYDIGPRPIVVVPPPPAPIDPVSPVAPPVVPNIPIPPVPPPPFVPPSPPTVFPNDRPVVPPVVPPTCVCPPERPNVVPEPATLVSAAIGAAVIGMARRRFTGKKSQA